MDKIDEIFKDHKFGDCGRGFGFQIQDVCKCSLKVKEFLSLKILLSLKSKNFNAPIDVLM